ncbi:MAG: hypothetical protein JNM56_40720 [Planctomycetia bacterium]|nr:hypothetical protein [Planctomycetia bacterium]
MQAPEQPLYVGWHRPNRREPWCQVCSADDERLCWRLLLDRGRGGEKVVLLRGRHPADRQAKPADRGTP